MLIFSHCPKAKKSQFPFISFFTTTKTTVTALNSNRIQPHSCLLAYYMLHATNWDLEWQVEKKKKKVQSQNSGRELNRKKGKRGMNFKLKLHFFLLSFLLLRTFSNGFPYRACSCPCCTSLLPKLCVQRKKIHHCLKPFFRCLFSPQEKKWMRKQQFPFCRAASPKTMLSSAVHR